MRYLQWLEDIGVPILIVSMGILDAFLLTPVISKVVVFVFSVIMAVVYIVLMRVLEKRNKI